MLYFIIFFLCVTLAYFGYIFSLGAITSLFTGSKSLMGKGNIYLRFIRCDFLSVFCIFVFIALTPSSHLFIHLFPLKMGKQNATVRFMGNQFIFSGFFFLKPSSLPEIKTPLNWIVYQLVLYYLPYRLKHNLSSINHHRLRSLQ